jgi:hypothetical protein
MKTDNLPSRIDEGLSVAGSLGGFKNTERYRRIGEPNLIGNWCIYRIAGGDLDKESSPRISFKELSRGMQKAGAVSH